MIPGKFIWAQGEHYEDRTSSWPGVKRIHVSCEGLRHPGVHSLLGFEGTLCVT